METITDRFSKAVDFLVKNKIVKSKGELSSMLNYKQTALSEILNGRSRVSAELARDFCKTYQISLQWLFYDEGEMFVEGAQLPKAEDLEEVTLNRKDLEQLVEQKIKQVLQQYHLQGLSAIQA
jgi:plasmid maintenance system antidote protein VapI